LNEQFYSSTSQDALQFFNKDPDAFKAYHNGYMKQVIQWPVKPLDVIIKQITPMYAILIIFISFQLCIINIFFWYYYYFSLKKLKKDSPFVIADFGCGDAKLARAFPEIRFHSFDLVAVNDYVTACDMAHTNLTNGSVDLAVFCLSLMGTNLQSFIKEANRVLKTGYIFIINNSISK